MFATIFSSVYSTEYIYIYIDNSLSNIPNFDLPSNVYFSLDNILNGLSTLKGNRLVVSGGISGKFLF